MSENFNAGQAVKEYIRKNNIQKANLSRALEVNPSNFEIRLGRSDMRIDFLMRLCKALEHNFFKDIAVTLPEGFSAEDPAGKAKDDRIKELELEVRMLKRERDMLKEIISGKIQIG